VPPEYEELVRWVELPEWARGVSSTLVREGIAQGGDWERWVPEGIRAAVARHYGSASS
jgi:phosphopantetheine adenylyltransferase